MLVCQFSVCWPASWPIPKPVNTFDHLFHTTGMFPVVFHQGCNICLSLEGQLLNDIEVLVEYGFLDVEFSVSFFRAACLLTQALASLN